MGLIGIPLCGLILCIGVARGIIKMNNANTRVENPRTNVKCIRQSPRDVERNKENNSDSSASYKC